MPRTKRAEPPGDDHSGRAREATRTLSPGKFALVMASVIVSIAMRNHHAYAISVFLMWVAGIAYTVLVVLHVWRILAFRAAVAADLAGPGLGFGFFTFIAGTDVLGAGSPPTDTIVPRSSCSRSAGSRGSCPDTWCRGAPCSATRASRSGNTRTGI